MKYVILLCSCLLPNFDENVLFLIFLFCYTGAKKIEQLL